MVAPTSDMVNVETFQASGLGYIQNAYCGIAEANSKFKNFDKSPTNLGDTVSFDGPIQQSFQGTLAPTFKGTTQPKYELTVDQEGSVAFSFSNQGFVFNAADYVDKFNMSATKELGANIEKNLWESTIGTHTYRTYYSGITANKIDPLNSYVQLADMLARYRNVGSPGGDLKVYIPDMIVPGIVNTGLNQFATNRNNESAASWDLGDFGGASFRTSNLLPLHTAGTVGNDGGTMTVVSINAAGDQLTISGGGANATLNANDIIEFNDSVAGQTNVRFLTRIGHIVSQQSGQLRVTANVTLDGTGAGTINIFPSLNSTVGDALQNVNTPIVAGMELKALPNHRTGLIVGGNALYLAMPQLPDESPFATANQVDKDTGASIRVYKGSKFAQNERGYVCDAIWGTSLVDDYAMRIALPE